MRRLGLLTLLLAAALGAAAAWLSLPAWQRRQDIRAIADADPVRRAAAWDRLTRATGGDPPPAARLLDAIHERLEIAGEDALLDAADALRPRRLWDWELQPRALFLRELCARSERSRSDEQLLVLDALEHCPINLEPADIIPLVQRLLGGGHEARAIDAALAWAGPQRVDALLELSIKEDALARRVMLAQACATTPQPHPLPPAALLAAEGLTRAEARLMWHVWANRDDASDLLRAQSEWPADVPPPPFSSFLRYSRDPRAQDRLERMAKSDDEAAAYALQAASPRDEAQARQVLANPDRPAWLRRLAAWRWPDIPAPLLRSVLDDDPTELDGSVFAAALLAEAGLPSAEGASLAEAWIRDLDDDRKRAGALLAALLGAHQGLLAEAEGAQDMAQVRRTQRMALLVMSGPAGAADLVELAHRVAGAGSEALDSDSLLCLLASGHVPSTVLLGSEPTGDWRLAVQQRSWLAQRFVPAWHERLGRPIGGDVRGLRLHFELLQTLALLEARRLDFDPITKTFRASARPAPAR